jgi:hypothetical protein
MDLDGQSLAGIEQKLRYGLIVLGLSSFTRSILIGSGRSAIAIVTVGFASQMDYMTDTMETAHSNQIFVPAHSPGGFVSTFVARVDGPAEDSLPTVRDTIRTVDLQVPVFGVKTMQQRMA